LEGKEESEGFIESSNGFSVFKSLLFEFSMLLLSDGSLVLDVLSGLFDSVVKVRDVGFEVLLLDVQDGLEESFAVSDIGVGRIDFTIKSSDFFGVLNGSGVVSLFSILELFVKVLDNFFNGSDELIKRSLGHHV